MIVVSDATPLIALARVGRLEILRDIFQKVLVPAAVWRELVSDGQGLAGAAQLAAAPWLESREVQTHQPIAEKLLETLDAGEAEAIALAREIGADVLLMDEKRGRAIAKEMGLSVTGLIGVLIRARELGIENEPAALVARMRARGVWISDALAQLLG